MSENSPTLVKVWLEAKNKKDLVTKQLMNNHAHSMRFIYGDFIKEGRVWVTYYFRDLGNELIKKEINDSRGQE